MEFTVKYKDGKFELCADQVYVGSYDTMLEATDKIEELNRKDIEEENQNGSKI